MAKKKKRAEKLQGVIADFRAMFYSSAVPAETKLLMGVTAVVAGLFTMRFAPRHAREVIPALIAVFEPPAVQHPEALEPVETKIDERQMGRSEVIRDIARGRNN